MCPAWPKSGVGKEGKRGGCVCLVKRVSGHKMTILVRQIEQQGRKEEKRREKGCKEQENRVGQLQPRVSEPELGGKEKRGAEPSPRGVANLMSP